MLSYDSLYTSSLSRIEKHFPRTKPKLNSLFQRRPGKNYLQKIIKGIELNLLFTMFL